MHYDLWDIESSNYFGRFEDEREALSLVRRLVTRYGDHYADELGLGRVADDGTILPPLSGGALIERVNEVLSPPEPIEERRGVVVAVAAVRKTGFSIEPMAAAAQRTLKRFTDGGHRRSWRG